VVALPAAVQRIVAFVALQDRPVLRPYAAGMLWLDCSDERAAANLRSALWRVHRTGHDFVRSDGRHLRLSPTVSVDLRVRARLARRLLDEPDADVDESLLGGEVLPDWYDEWVLFERERFRQLRLHALETLCERLAGERRFSRAVDVGLAAVAADPLRESAHRVLIRVHLAEGNAHEALRQFRLCRRLLAQQLGLEPSPELRQLVAPLGARA